MKNFLQNPYSFHEIEPLVKEIWNTQEMAVPKFKNGKEFTIVIPPPNVTGHLHLGHAWDGVIQDAIIRYKRSQNFNSLWIPGTDHAGIATQVKFEKYLKENNIDKNSLGKEKFLAEIYKWKDMQANFIHSQWNEMGFLLDYSKEKFTLDEECSEAVLNTFVKLYHDGLIYEGYKLTNWDYKLKTAISDIEVIYEDTKSKFYYIKYPILNEENQIIDSLLIATTRPETMFGDTAIFVNPDDERYKQYIGLRVVNPANDQFLTVLSDSYIEPEFGTGVMKCTPAHDFNDYELGKKHGLESINILNDDATLNNNVPKEYQGLNIEQAREKLVKNLEERGFLDHVEEINNRVGHSERTGVIIQPYLTKQWFLKTSVLAQDVLQMQKTNKKVEFLPPRFENTLIHWLSNMEDWCISRQLWWGHQLPIWYHKKTNEVYCDLIPPRDEENWTRSTDVLDTWYSSGLWPMECLDWNGKDSRVFNSRFPTDVLVTGYDIIFFWVARMMMFSSYFVNDFPFRYVYIHGLVKDEQNRKMSKSLGNGIEPQKLVEEYGNDALRIFFLSDSSSGEDIAYKPDKLKQATNFLIKLWNTAKFIELKGFKYNKEFNVDLKKNNAVENWILHRLNEVAENVKTNLDKYSFNIAFKYLKDFIWDDFCNFYLECMKLPEFNNQYSQELFMAIYKDILIFLQTFTPFISEYLYQLQIKEGPSILNEQWLSNKKLTYLMDFEDTEIVIRLISKIRQIRNVLKNEKEVFMINLKQPTVKLVNIMKAVLPIVKVEFKNLQESEELAKIIITIGSYVFYLFVSSEQVEEYKAYLNKEIARLKDEVDFSTKQLSNKNFVEKGDKELVEKRKQKLAFDTNELDALLKEIQENFKE